LAATNTLKAINIFQQAGEKKKPFERRKREKKSQNEKPKKENQN